MSIPEYFVALRDRQPSSLAELANHLRGMPKKRVGDVTVSELCSMAEYPNGLYLLFDESNALWYVGKSTSRSFIERVPSHFDQREDAWFNTLPKKIMTFSKIVAYADAQSLGLSLRLVLVGVQSKGTALKLERMLRAYMTPHLNTERKLKCTGNEPLASFEA